MDEATKRIKEFNEDLEKLPLVKTLCQSTGLTPALVGTSFIIISLLVVAYNFPYYELILQIVGTVYPCIKSV